MTPYAFQLEEGGEPLEDGLNIHPFATDAEAIAAAQRQFTRPNPFAPAASADDAEGEVDPDFDPETVVSMSVSTATELLGRWTYDDRGKVVWIAEGAPE